MLKMKKPKRCQTEYPNFNKINESPFKLIKTG